MNVTKEFVILYVTNNEFGLTGYTGSYWVGSLDDRKSTSIYMFHMGLGAISWASKKKHHVKLFGKEEC